MKLRNATFLIAVGVSLLIHLSAIPISVRVHTGGHPVEADGHGFGGSSGEMRIVFVDEPPEEAEKQLEESLAPEDARQAEPEGQPDESETATEDARQRPDEPEFPETDPAKPEPEEKPDETKEALPKFLTGDPDGTGYASNEAPGDREATARLAPADQAFLSRDPRGAGKVGDDPSMNPVRGADGRGGTPGRPGPQAATPPQPPAPPAGKPAPIGAITSLPTADQLKARVLQWAQKVRPGREQAAAAESPRAAKATVAAAPKPTRPTAERKRGGELELSPPAPDGRLPQRGAETASRKTPKIPAAPVEDPESIPGVEGVKLGEALVLGERTDEPRESATPQVVVPPVGVPRRGLSDTAPPPREPSPRVTVRSGNGDGHPPGSELPAADPAPMSDTESDPFSTLGAAVTRDGRLSVRFGRKFRARRPRLTLAGKMELLEMTEPKVTLDVSIDESGRVTGVQVAKSSGSNEVDQPTRVAMYDWWFEPKRDPSGGAVPDRFQFTISWH